jgi:propanol-preferring alcohol dehydrogenase
MKCGWAGLPPTPTGQIGGHEGVGIVQKLGPGCETSSVKLGDRVGIKWVAAYCGKCAPCKAGFDGHCDLKKFSGYVFPPCA